MDQTPLQDSEPAAAPPVPHLAAKARLLLLFTVLLIAAAVTYLLYARGVFEPTQQLVLTTDDSEGVSVGMDMTFSGFPIGRVRRVELGPSGEVRIHIDVAQKDAHWLRTSSVFTLVRGLVGGTAIRAFTGVLTDPPLADGAERPVLRGDATAELPRVIASAREVLENLTAMTSTDAALRNSIANVQALTDKLKGPQGALGVLFGNDADARKLVATLERTNALLARFDTLAAKADTQVFGPEGVVRETRATVVQLNGLLADTRASLKKIDSVLVEAQAVGANVRGATEDLGTLRGDVEANLRKIDSLINEINRKWPFARETEIKLP
ncbi:MCE family protein [Ramlibacter henchirensis]|uniref:MCE family protein n=1 Tax=Ramlibacter henchirensis TaxID=204072 RepID=A0A4Z0C7U4_9BURK|nr:MlaD family protein [Ramlibacter henchirensis]TFZ06510.1 MCE family protein [Ramlibacter henchirensis]